MTITSTPSEIPYVGDGVSTVFTIPFVFDTSADLKVVETAAGVPTVVTTGFSIGGGGGLPGTLTRSVALPVGTNLLILDNPALTQPVDYQDNDAFPAATHEAALDRVTRITKRLNERVDRSLRVTDGDLIDGDNNLLPISTVRQGKYLTFDAQGRPTVASGTGNDSALRTDLASSVSGSDGSRLSGYRRTEAGALARSVFLALSATVYASDFAVGDGATDDTTALQAAFTAAAGKRLVFTSALTYKITAALSIPSNIEVEAAPGTTIRQYTANANVVTASAQTNIKLRGLTFYAVGSMSSTFNGQGAFFTGCTYVDVTECVVTNHRGFGIMFYNSGHCAAWFNRLINSPVANADAWSNVGGDIAIEGNSSYCKVSSNECISGNGVALQIQPLANTDISSYNIIANNIVANPKMYGVNVYLGDPASTMIGNVVTGNTIKNVTGYVYFTAPGTYPFGAGIYSNGGSDTVISNNTIDGTNTAALVWSDTLAQGGIGVTNVGKCVISGNTIRGAGQYGISVRDPGAVAPATQQVSVIGNIISGSTNISLQVKERANVNIADNQIYNGASHGIYIDNTTTMRHGVSVKGNIVDTVAGIGIFHSFCQSSPIVGNTIKGATSHGLYVINGQDIPISANTVYQPGGTYGVYVDATVVRFTLEGNNVYGSGAAPTYGYFLGARWPISVSNLSNNCVNEYGGSYVPYFAAAPAAGTWVQRDKVWSSAPTSANFIGWVCTASGSPGTWKTFGVIS